MVLLLPAPFGNPRDSLDNIGDFLFRQEPWETDTSGSLPVDLTFEIKGAEGVGLNVVHVEQISQVGMRAKATITSLH